MFWHIGGQTETHWVAEEGPTHTHSRQTDQLINTMFLVSARQDKRETSAAHTFQIGQVTQILMAQRMTSSISRVMLTH